MDWYRDEARLLRELKQLRQREPPVPEIPGYADFRELRRGGQGVVYTAIQQSTRRRVAIKILGGGSWASEERRRRFQREVDVIAALRHPDIVQLYDAGLAGQGFPYFVMEFIDGVGLEELLPSPWQSAACDDSASGSASALGRVRAIAEAAGLGTVRGSLALVARICVAVGYAHARGVIHRDIKPSNIRIDPAGAPHVLDFGLARAAQDSLVADTGSAMTHTGEFVGSLPWASPEQSQGTAQQLDTRTDVYSLGVVLYQLLTGQFPYSVAGGLGDVLDRIRTVEPITPRTLRREIDADVSTIVLKCLAKEPARRYRDAGDLARDIQRYLVAEPIAARPDSLVYRLSRRIRRNRTTAALAAALTIALGATVAGALWWRHAEYRRRYAAEYRPDGLIVVNTAILGQNVPTELRPGSTLRANELHNLPDQATFPGSLDLGHAGGDGRGRHAIHGGQHLVVGENLRIGVDAPGELEVRAGGTVRSASGHLGFGVGSRGEATIFGAGAVWECGSLLCVGAVGPATLNLLAGGHMKAGALRIGQNASGYVRVDGADSTMECSTTTIGENVEGTLELRAGARFVTSSARIGSTESARGALSVRGTGSAFVVRSDDDFDIGFAGEGRIYLADGAESTARNYVLGRTPTGDGLLIVSGSATRLSCRRAIYVGHSGLGHLEIRDGASCDGTSLIASGSASVGSVIVNGDGSVWRGGMENVSVGILGAGSLRIADGAVVSCGDGHLAAAEVARGDAVIGGRGAAWELAGSLYVGGSPDGAGGEARLVVERDGCVAVADVARLYRRGQLVLDGGTIATDAFENTRGGTLALNRGAFCARSVSGNLTNIGAVVAALHTPGGLEINGDFAQTGGELRIRLFGAQQHESDRVRVTGVARLGGALSVELCDGFMPLADDRLEILSAACIDGEFDGSRPRLALAGGGSCVVLYEENAVVLTDFTGPFAPRLHVEEPSVASVPRWEPGTTGPYPGRISRNTTGESDRRFLGPPDKRCLGLGGQIVEYDFGDRRIVDGPGSDFAVYEAVWGSPEYPSIDVLVSVDGREFINLKGSEAPNVRVPGDEVYEHARRACGYDLSWAGLSAARYVRIDGRGDGPAGAQPGFDLDAIGAIHFIVVEPTTDPPN